MAERILTARDIYKSFEIKSHKRAEVLKGISLEIKKGEFTALMGPSGVGKSTLLHILGSLDTFDKGEIELKIKDKLFIFSTANADSFNTLRNSHIGFIFQFHHLLPEFTALENVMMPALIAGDSFAKASEKANEFITAVGVESQKEQKPSELSGGEQQRIAIARALINSPDIVLADEPTGNLDIENANSILELISKLRKDFSMTFIIATHSRQVADIADRILVMADGKIIK